MSTAPPHTDFQVECRNLDVHRGARSVLSKVNLHFGRGECLALIGPNGAGKTTLLLTLLGILRPASGSADLLADGVATPLHRLAAARRARLFAYLPQAPEHVPPHEVYDVVAGGRHVYTRPLEPLSPADHQAIREALRAVDMLDLADRPLTELSGGERQKALLAASLAQDAEMLFLDEPTAALDPAYQAVLVERLREWRAASRGVVFVSHDLQLPMALEARILALRGGRVLADGPAAEVLSPARLREIYDAGFQVFPASPGRSIVVPGWWG